MSSCPLQLFISCSMAETGKEGHNNTREVEQSKLMQETLVVAAPDWRITLMTISQHRECSRADLFGLEADLFTLVAALKEPPRE